MNTENPVIDTEANRQEFLLAVRNAVQRPGIESLLEYLDSTDFFYAPASTIYHLSCEGGLVAHSLSVYRQFNWLCDKYFPTIEAESRAIMALLHDVCKVHCYNPCRKSRKTGELNGWGKPIWEDYDAYEFVEEFPFGHGEKSVYLINQHMRLTPEEAMAIRWHMGMYDNSAKGDSRPYNNACDKFPVIKLLHCADEISAMLGW